MVTASASRIGPQGFTPRTVAAETITAEEMGKIRSGKNWFMGGVKIVALGIGLIPVIGGGISGAIGYVTDRISNGTEARKELQLRTRYYSKQIGETLGMDPRNVRIADFAQAAKINPQLRKLYDEPLKKRNAENRESALINGGAAAAGVFIPGGGTAATGVATLVKGVRGAGAVAYTVKTVAGGLAGGALGAALAKDKVNTQELIEAMDTTLQQADSQGLPRTQVVNTQSVFLLRASQDALFMDQIAKQFGTPLHKMDEQKFTAVMNSYPALAQSSEREAYAIANGIMPLRDLAGTAPNLNGNFAGPMVRNSNASHVNRLAQQRAAVNDTTTIANDNGTMTHAERIRAQQATRAADQGLAG